MRTGRILGYLALGALMACASGGKVPDVPVDAAVPPIDSSVPVDGQVLGDFGDPCQYHSDCQGGVCYRADQQAETGVCTQECTGNCPDGYECKVVMIDDFTDLRICVLAEETFCDTCETNQDCGDSGDLCIELSAGKFCTIDCAGNPGICPTGFTCQRVQGSGDTVVGMQCMPLSGVCCIDGDGDLRGAGAGCVTTDCDDGNPDVYDDAVEVCDGYDNDCVGGVDVDPTDCAGAQCLLGPFGYYERAAEPCASATCEEQSAVLCGLYTCSGGGEAGDACATSCDVEDDAKCVPTAHCDSSACSQDQADGLACDENSDCQSGHCQNGFCCAFGDCCQTASDCPTFGTFDPICENPSTCQGSRGEAVCGASFICASTGMQQDDSACGAATVASECGWYLPILCNGQVSQAPPSCPTSCTRHADCDAGAFCNPATGTCVEDLDNGGACGADSARCKSGHCQNGFCCSGGDCCQTEANCPAQYSSPPVCTVPSACQGDRDVAQCNDNQCSTSVNVDDDSACGAGQVASDCGPYNPVLCDGSSVQTPPVCPTSCTSDLDCDSDAYCNASGACVPDQPDGGACTDSAECRSGHCQNGFCCATGDCCAASNDCNAYDSPSTCNSVATCQGTRVDGVCTAEYQCTAVTTSDDSGCVGLEADACGPYPPEVCTAAQTQNPPVCATSCTNDSGCDISAHCDSGMCVPDTGPGGYCDEPSDCNAGLYCVDSVCCNSACNGGCEACDLPGSVGTCTLVAAGQDPDNECGAVSCGSYYWGWSGDTCYQRADVSATQATCDGAGACRTAAQECGASGQGSATITCDSFCQDPRTATTCTGTTAGTCTNVSQGSESCGDGVCRVTVPKCTNGTRNVCEPNWDAQSPETCNNLDDNCNATVDDGSFSDSLEPNGACTSVRTLNQVGSNSTITYSNLTVYGAGDHDYFKIHMAETDSSCSSCDWTGTDEDFQITISLTVPSGAGSYMFCTGTSCGGVDANCKEVLAGQTGNWVWKMDGFCGTTESFDRYVHIYGDNSPGYECLPYTLTYEFVPGCFDA